MDDSIRLIPPYGNFRSRSLAGSVVAIVDGINLSEQSLTLVLHVCTELVERGHEVRLVIRKDDQGRVMDLMEWIVPRRLFGEVNEIMVVATGVRQVLVDAVVPNGWRVGICDLLSRRAAMAFEEAGVPYYCIYPGTAKVLACAGILPSVVAPYACAKLYMRKQYAMLADDVTAQRHAEEATEREIAKLAVMTYNKAEGLFIPSFEEADSPSFWTALQRRKPHSNLHFIRSIAIRPTLLPSLPADAPYTRLLESEVSVPVIVIDLGRDEEFGLTAIGIRALFQGLCAGRGDWCAIWRVGDARIFCDAISTAELDTHASWLVPLGISSDRLDKHLIQLEPPGLPLIQLLMHPRVACLISTCDWTACTAALSAGVPVLALPVSVEQSLNATTLDELGVARVLWESLDQRTDGLLLNPPTAPDIRGPERFSRRHVAQALRELLAPESDLQLNSLNVQVSYYGMADSTIGTPVIIDAIEYQAERAARQYDADRDHDFSDTDDEDDNNPYDPTAAYLDDNTLMLVLAAKHVQCDVPCQDFSCSFLGPHTAESSRDVQYDFSNTTRHLSPKKSIHQNQRPRRSHRL